MKQSVPDDRLSASDVLKLAGITRATLTRWMDSNWVKGRALTRQFPAGELRDGKTKVWDRSAVEAWLEENADRLGRHQSGAPKSLFENPVLQFSLEKAAKAAELAAAESEAIFDMDAEIRTIEEKLRHALRSKGVKKVRWNGRAMDLHFSDTPRGDEDRVLFVLAYS